MKIIAVGMNYAQHNREMQHTEVNCEPVIFLKPDSALLKEGKPFFLPDFDSSIHYETEVVVRISRLGKHIDAQYARRYYDAVTVGIDFTARDLQSRLRAEAKPWELSKGFDGSAAIGRFVPLQMLGGDVQALDFRLTIDDREVQHGHTGDMLFRVDDIIAYVSRFMTLKMGDLLYTGTPAGVGAVQVGNHLEGYLCGEKVLECNIR